MLTPKLSCNTFIEIKEQQTFRETLVLNISNRFSVELRRVLTKRFCLNYWILWRTGYIINWAKVKNIHQTGTCGFQEAN